MLTRSTLALCVAAGATLAIGTRASAQTWTGGSAVDSNWTTALNWTALPANNGTANIIFAGTTRLTPQLNIAQDILSLTFNNTAGAFIIGGGQTLSVRAGGIVNNDAGTQSFTAPLVVAAVQTWDAAVGGLTTAGAITLNANLTVDGSGATTLNGGVGGSGQLIKTGSGVLQLGASNTYLGGTSLLGGTLRLIPGGTIPDVGGVIVSGTLDLNGQTETIGSLTGAATGVISLPAASVLTVNQGVNDTFSGTVSGPSTATFVKTGGGLLNLAGASSFLGTYRVDAGLLQLTVAERLDNASTVLVNGGNFAVSGVTETIGTLVLIAGVTTGSSGQINASAFDLRFGSCGCRMGGSGGITKTTPSTVTISRSCLNTGPTDVQAGTLLLSVSNALTANTAVVNISSGATLQILQNVSQSIDLLTGNGTVDFLGNTLFSQTLSVGNAGGSSTFAGLISGAGIFAKNGAGTFTLSGTATNFSGVVVNGGVFRPAASERISDTVNLTVNTSATFDLQAFNETCFNLVLNGGTLTGTGTLAAQFLTFSSGNAGVVLAGPARLIKSTNGLLTLTGANTYTGGTQLDAGVTAISADVNLGRAGDTLTLGSGTLRTLSTLTLARPIDIASVGGGTIETLATTTLTGPLSSTSTGALVKSGPGTLILSNSGASCGGILVSAGTLLVSPGVSVDNIFSSLVSTGGSVILDNAYFAGPSTINQGGRVTLRHGAIHNGIFSNTDGVLAGDGVVNGALINAASADVRVASGEYLLFAGPAAHSNLGLLDVVGGELEFDAALTNGASTGLIFARDATLRFNGGLTNQGSIGLSFGVTDLYGDVNNTGGGTITISGASDATFVDDVVNNGIIRTSSGSAAVFFGALSGSGSFPGTGTVFMEGDLRPGNSPGQVEFGGNLVLGGGAILQTELAGEEPSQYDRVTVARTAELDGTLDVHPFNGFSLDGTGIHHFTVVAASAVIGRFTAVQIAAPLASLRVRYTGSAVVLTTCAADFNLDGSLDPDDLADYIGAFFALPPGQGSDFNGDGTTDPDDLADYIGAFFAGC